MRRFYLPFLTFLFFICESLFVDLLPAQLFGIDRIFVPRFVLIIIMMITIYFDQYNGMFYGIGFGLLYDLIYTDLIGVYMFAFAIIAYFISLIIRFLHTNLVVVLFISMTIVAAVEFFIYGIYLLIGVADMNVNIFGFNRLIPTVILNGVFVILIFYPVRRFLITLRRRLRQQG